MKRREFLTVPVKSLGGLLIYGVAGEAIRLQAQEGALRIPLRFFTAAEARTVQAACARIFPSDESGPGANEANVIVYIDRQLAGPWGRDKYRYTKGPWVESFPEHGYQAKENPRQIYRAGIPSLGDDFSDRCRRRARTSVCAPSSAPRFSSCCARIPSKECSAIRCTAGTRDSSAGSWSVFPGPA